MIVIDCDLGSVRSALYVGKDWYILKRCICMKGRSRYIAESLQVWLDHLWDGQQNL